MKIMTLNANGIRAAHRKKLFEWMLKQQCDVVCIQETRAQMHQLPEEILSPNGYFGFFNDAEKKGYSGVAIYSKQRPDAVKKTLGWHHADTEGRYIQADFGSLSIISLYLPSGSSSEERQTIKYDFLDRFMPVLEKIQVEFYLLIHGDWEIVGYFFFCRHGFRCSGQPVAKCFQFL